MQQRILKWLDISEIRIIKQVIIISDRRNGESEIGSIIYTRPISNNYTIGKAGNNIEPNSESSVIQLLKGFPEQKSYPTDNIDQMIISAVQKIYPKSIVRNDSILLNVDFEKLDLLKNRNSFKAKLYFSPQFSNFSRYSEFSGKEFKAPVVDLNIYSFYQPEFIDGHIFHADYDATDSDALLKLDELKFE